MIFRYNFKSNNVFYTLNSFYKVYKTALKNRNGYLGNILYKCTLLHINCEHIHDLYTLNSLSGWKGLTKFIPRDCLNSTLTHILFSLLLLTHERRGWLIWCTVPLCLYVYCTACSSWLDVGPVLERTYNFEVLGKIASSTISVVRMAFYPLNCCWFITLFMRHYSIIRSFLFIKLKKSDYCLMKFYQMLVYSRWH